eukprot:NODE_749_length_4582_cov_0.475797.p3 type:complete len:110 gc:universal NODE_749_length_4582_cov_0.475797:2234-1905(-)
MLLVNGKTLVVAPISAPMLHMVPMPVADKVSTPGPKYSTIWPVPPLTVRISANLHITSLDAPQPLSLPLNLTPMTFGHFSSHGNLAITSTASAPPTPTAIMPNPPPFGV